MAIITSHNITIQIDELKFNITKRALTKKEAKEFGLQTKERIKKYKELDALNLELSQLESEFNINKCILEDGNKDDKSKIVFEQKELNKKIPALKKQIEQTDQNGLFNELESMSKDALMLTISGEDKDKLFEAVETKDISFIALSEEINEMVNQVVKKK